ncbi:uncharacterized protein LOC105843928 isoform X2 [Hydra vulgaris]|nr:uncharacterized protein LOC105843928 [Hydra vulgaris]XP_047146821.1 uncharacterized protein LOC105843928 [Hydra vulgaris]XP_047146822.1 uncharacterized protein LOC105843928 [Hydra vulgaris]XP_047146823.1 uncharacterized protein LOC105843928 [Hydra vulgaris]XP_047146824.1 uncharacterized protein LOC105843928 [Hydra vulgaris]
MQMLYLGFLLISLVLATKTVRKESYSYSWEVSEHDKSFVKVQDTEECALRHVGISSKTGKAGRNLKTLTIFLDDEFCNGRSIIETVDYRENEKNAWKRIKNIKQLNSFIKIQKSSRNLNQIDITITKEKPGIMLKINFGCKEKNTKTRRFKERDCIVFTYSKLPFNLPMPHFKDAGILTSMPHFEDAGISKPMPHFEDAGISTSMLHFEDADISTKPPISEIQKNQIIKKFAKNLFSSSPLTEPILPPQQFSTHLLHDLNNKSSLLSISNQSVLPKKKVVGWFHLSVIIATTLALVGMVFSYASYQILSDKKLNSEKKILQEKHFNFSIDYGCPEDVAPLVHEIHSKMYADSTDEQEAFLLQQKM